MVVGLVFIGVLMVVESASAGIYLRISDTGTFSLSNRPSNEAFQLVTGTSSREELDRTEEAVDIAAGKYGLPASLIFAVINNSNDRRGGGMMGLPEELRSSMSDTAINDVKKNILAGSRHLSDLLADFDGNLFLALGAFYSGKESVKKHDGLPNEQVRTWVNNVQQSFGEFENREEIIYTYKDEDGVVHVANIQP